MILRGESPARGGIESGSCQKAEFRHDGTNKVYFLTTGMGPKTIVFVHGWASNGNFWNEQVPALEANASSFFSICPGMAKATSPTSIIPWIFLGARRPRGHECGEG